MWVCPNFGNDIIGVSRKKIKVISRVSSVIMSFFIFSVTVTPVTCLICLLVFQILCHSYVKDIPHWLPSSF